MIKARNQAKPQRDIQQEIAFLSKLEDDWLEERNRGETAVTSQLLDDLYEGGSSDGVLQTKKDFVKAVEASTSGFTRGEHSERKIRIYGDVAISSGVAKLTSASREHAFRYLRVYVKRGSAWHLVASQSARQVKG